MRPILCFALLCGVGLWADEAQDRAAIDKVIAALNDPVHRARLFAEGVEPGVDFDRLLDLHRKASAGELVISMDEAWTVLTVPRVVSGPIRFTSPSTATVAGASIIRGAQTFRRRVPLLFVMKKEGTEWRISSVRAVRYRACPTCGQR